MRTLRRNQTAFTYQNYTGKTAVVDSDGNETGEYTETYGTIQSTKGYISVNRNNDSEEMFGTGLNYDKVIIMSSSDINEYSKVYLLNGSTTETYKVVKIAQSLNSVSIAIQKEN